MSSVDSLSPRLHMSRTSDWQLDEQCTLLSMPQAMILPTALGNATQRTSNEVFFAPKWHVIQKQIGHHWYIDYVIKTSIWFLFAMLIKLTSDHFECWQQTATTFLNAGNSTHYPVEFFCGYINMYLHYLSLPNSEMAQVVGILPNWRQGPCYLIEAGWRIYASVN